MHDAQNAAQAEAPITQNEPRAPGFYLDVREADYHAGPEVSSTRLKRFAQAPAKVLVRQRETKALAFGSLTHMAVLQPHLLEETYCVTDLPRISEREKATQEEMKRAGGRELVKRDDWEAALRMRDTIHSHPTLRDMFAPVGLVTEASFYWIDPATGLRCRGRVDALRTDWNAVLDIKTTEDASPDAFARTVANYQLHWQQAFYEAGLEATRALPTDFFFIAIEKEAPNLPAIFELRMEAVDLARRQVRDTLEAWARCEATGIWPGYDERPQRIDLPPWARAGEYA